MKCRPRLAAIPAIVLGACIVAVLAPAVAQTSGVVSVLYAGSLVTPMEGPIRASLATKEIVFQGEGAGSKQLANEVASGVKSPDIFISVDPQLVAGLRSMVARAETFAGTSLSIGWSNKSRFASLFNSVVVGKTSVLNALQTPGLKIGRTDPLLDPKGAYTVQAMKLLAGTEVEKQILGPDENAAQTFPEQDLLARIDLGEADVGFFYKTEAVARGLHFVALPGRASMSDKLTYTIALMKGAPHPDAAKAFWDFILTGDGKTILQKAGVEYLDTPTALPGVP